MPNELKKICHHAMIEGQKIDLKGCIYGPHVKGFFDLTCDYYFFLAGFVKSQNLTNILDIGTGFGGSIMSMSRGTGEKNIPLDQLEERAPKELDKDKEKKEEAKPEEKVTPEVKEEKPAEKKEEKKIEPKVEEKKPEEKKIEVEKKEAPKAEATPEVKKEEAKPEEKPAEKPKTEG